MAHLFFATLGQRPEAITMALDYLQTQYNFAEIAILHTSPRFSAITHAYDSLRVVLHRDYPDIPVRWHELLRRDGSALIDINNAVAATDYYHAIYNVLREYVGGPDYLHFLVAGGRKAMSIYATLSSSQFWGRDLTRDLSA